MQSIYLDNAATTPMEPEVVKVMQESMLDNFGNPSSIHQFGRKAKVAVETARKKIAKHFNVSANEIFFTAGGTEADNLVLYNAVENLEVKRIITSKIEHHAVLNTVESLKKKHAIEVVYVELNEVGQVNLNNLENLLKESDSKTLITLMMVNNEIGNLLPVENVCNLCRKYNALFHSDTVQAIGHYNLDLKETPIDFIVASAHKFHGPKGVGFVYSKKEHHLKPMFLGGGQERGVRASTENVHAIIGMEKALAISYESLEKDKEYISSLKKFFIEGLSDKFIFNGLSDDFEKSIYTILNARFPVVDKMLLFNLDLAGISVSGGSACQSGSNKGSHVLKELLSKSEAERSSVRFSFSKYNSIDELKKVIEVLKKMV